MTDADVRTLAAVLSDLRPRSPGSTVGERLMWRRIVEGIATLLPELGRREFLNRCEWDNRSIFGMQTCSLDPAAAARTVEELRDHFRMTDARLQSLHHRRNLRPSDGISAHLRYLSSVKTLRDDQQQLARRLKACKDFLAAGDSWAVASRKAEKAFPGSRSK